MDDRDDSPEAAQVRRDQAARNEDSRAHWTRYAPHRQRVLGLLLPLARAGGRLLLVGAGNCNDLDLQRLQPHFTHIHLADVDGDAMRWGLAQQGLTGHPAFVLHEGVELTGASPWQRLTAAPGAASADDLQQATAALRSHQWRFAEGGFDVVASVGVLSQLLEPALLALPAGSPLLLPWASAVRLHHLRLLLQATRTGGHAVLVTEILSSDTCPALTRTPEAALSALLSREITSGNFFTGLNPAVLRTLWTEAPELAPLTHKLQVSPAWRWDFGARIYACCAFAALRR